MAQLIEFDTLTRFTPTVKWRPDERRGKVIPFMPQREVSDELVPEAHEELDLDSSPYPERDDAFYQAALDQAQPIRLEEESEDCFQRRVEKVFGVVHILGFFSDGSSIGS